MSEMLLKNKDLFAAPSKKQRKPRSKNRKPRLPGGPLGWWKEHGSWLEIHGIVPKDDGRK